MSVCFLNGDYCLLSEAKISVLDRGFIFGDAVYEVLPAMSGRFFGLAQHLDRLNENLTKVDIDSPYSSDEWKNLLTALSEKNGNGDLSFYIQVTRGVAERNHVFPSGCKPTIFIMCSKVKRSESVLNKSCITRPDNRWGRCDIKTTSLLPNLMLKNEASLSGAFEVILLKNGILTEGASSNVFVVSKGVVKTPEVSHSILPGVTRDFVLEVLDELNIACEKTNVAAEELFGACEIWLTSSTNDLICVNELDGNPVGNGCEYPLFRRVSSGFVEAKMSELTG
jgi:D-alanine transaminase